MDTVFINQLQVDTTIGVYDWEKEIKQTLYFDFEIQSDTVIAAQQDDIEKALDYAKVSAMVTDYVQSNSFELIETVAEHVAALVLKHFNTIMVKVKVIKPGAVENANSVAVQITRGVKA